MRLFLDCLVDVLFHEIESFSTGSCCQRKSFGDCIDGDDTLGAEKESTFDGKLTDRTTSPNRNRLAAFNVAKLGSHIAGGKNVRQKQRLLVRKFIRHFDRADIGVRHPQIFGLAAREAAEDV